MNPITFGSLFAGIGGIDLGFDFLENVLCVSRKV
jgi:site-specific DNA-cytosine methylase